MESEDVINGLRLHLSTSMYLGQRGAGGWMADYRGPRAGDGRQWSCLLPPARPSREAEQGQGGQRGEPARGPASSGHPWPSRGHRQDQGDEGVLFRGSTTAGKERTGGERRRHGRAEAAEQRWNPVMQADSSEAKGMGWFAGTWGRRWWSPEGVGGLGPAGRGGGRTAEAAAEL